MNLIRSGVLTPEKEGEGGANEEVDCVGEGIAKVLLVGERREDEEGFGERGLGEEVEAIVVLRCRFVVSVEGGGGRFEVKEVGERMEARQRKHSPVPK